MTGILIVDKPKDWTSHDVIAKLRGIYGERRIGHAGTLDPMATGVLTVFLGRATRAASFCEADEKEYFATLRLGVETDTQDITGNLITSQKVETDAEELQRVLMEFTGKQEQIPPMYSAVKINGQRLYKLARSGQTVERKPRTVEIRTLELLSFDGQDAKLRIICSKGTYIRTLCADIGRAAGCGGCMAELRRTRAGVFSIGEAATLQEIQNAKTAGTHAALLLPVDRVFSDFPPLYMDSQSSAQIKNGREIRIDGLPDGKYRVYNGAEFLMLGEYRQGMLRTVKSFFEVI